MCRLINFSGGGPNGPRSENEEHEDGDGSADSDPEDPMDDKPSEYGSSLVAHLRTVHMEHVGSPEGLVSRTEISAKIVAKVRRCRARTIREERRPITSPIDEYVCRLLVAL